MAIFKCKMCGGTLEINVGESVATCEYCGTQQTLPKLDNERRANLYDRANHFRRNNEFDKAMGIYEQVLNEDNSDAEAYWSLVLCRYGIEYVEDPTSHKRVPTVNRAQFTSVFDDDNYKSALQYADDYQRSIYEEEAKTINEIQKGILAVSQKEEPFDVFICYKETDNNGSRTPDSVLANDLYHQLTQEGFKVFFARITLEDKLGSAYEPYIFAALNSAKVMVVLGTKSEYFNAVWVKNEWSRYLALIKNGAKKMLVPAYKDMDPYDLPEEFSHLQAQDMGKLGFMQDLIRGIKKIAQTETPEVSVVKETVVAGSNAATAPLLKRAFIFLEDGDWASANEYCEKVLDLEPENAMAYLGKLMSELRVKTQASLKDLAEPFDRRNNYQKVLRFGDEALKNELRDCTDFIVNRNLTNAYNKAVSAMGEAADEEAYRTAAKQFDALEDFRDSKKLAQECLIKAEEARLTVLYNSAVSAMAYSNDEEEFKSAAQKFNEIKAFRDAEAQAKICLEKAEAARKDAILADGTAKMSKDTLTAYEAAITLFETISGWKDANEKIDTCQKKIEEIKAKEEAERLEQERKAEIARIEAERIAKRNKKIAMIATPIVCAVIAFIVVLITVIIPTAKKNHFIATYGQEIYDKFGLVAEGKYITFGAYEQDANESNGKESIEWLVLEVKGGKALVISKFALDYGKYYREYSDVTWESSDLRTWLNDEFINAAFSDDEKVMIPEVTVSADKNPLYNNNPGKDTKDRVFVLSGAEADQYFRSDGARQCEPTKYAVANGAWRRDNGNCVWWLRSHGHLQKDAAQVDSDGCVDHFGDAVSHNYSIRPALWIDLNS